LSVGLFAIWIIIWGYIDRKQIDPRIISLVATMAALATLTRVAFAPIAAFKPTTFIVLITGYVGGPWIGFATGALTGLASNFFLGQGPWTPWQMVCWGLCGSLAGWLGRTHQDIRLWPLVALAGLCGFFYGWVMNIWHWIAFIQPLTMKTLVATYAASLPFDLLHAAGNVTFTWLLGRPFYHILHRVFVKIRLAALPAEKLGS